MELPSERLSWWKWQVCGLLLCATMLNYMDRQTLSLTITEITAELKLNNEQYGDLEKIFGYAFAAGGLLFGLLADRFSIRWLYPLVFLGWSFAGAATSAAQSIGETLVSIWPSLGEGTVEHAAPEPAYWGLLLCRGALGFFEAGHWPCAVVTTRRLLSPQDRPLGNSLLQSGASLGAILAPIAVMLLVKEGVIGSWRTPYLVIGLVGALWVIPWIWLLSGSSLAPAPRSDSSIAPLPHDSQSPWIGAAIRRFVAVLIIVVAINLTWQYYRAWLPKFLREYHSYSRDTVSYFTSAYYIATDLGCLTVGFMVKRMVSRGWEVHKARATTFITCAALTSLGFFASSMPAGPGLFVLLLIVGFGALGLFPTYYSLAQELSRSRTGLMTGILGAATWTITGFMQTHIGRSIDETANYSLGLQLAAAAPLVAVAGLLIFWNPWQRTAQSLIESPGNERLNRLLKYSRGGNRKGNRRSR